jgi:radical SAM protein with 4Fe4S-binding SPASM domain
MEVDKLCNANFVETTSYVTLELSNMCNYAHLHKECPAWDIHKKGNKKVLSSEVVYDVLQYLSLVQYSQTIAFAIHNDPLNDPRLMHFIHNARELCPLASINIGTNGWYLTTSMVRELYAAGASFFLVSAYTKSEEHRLKQVRAEVSHLYKIGKLVTNSPHPPSFGINPLRTKFDNRKMMNFQDPSKLRPCNAPLTELVITSNGDLGLCCVDVWRKNNFGNISSKGFVEIMKKTSPTLERLRTNLREGMRDLDVCQKCTYVDRWQQAKNNGDQRWTEHLLSSLDCELS